jgi:AcrR family transcriptional regulator
MRIESAALEVFTRKGIQNASIREIADKAGGGASTIYGYYI